MLLKNWSRRTATRCRTEMQLVQPKLGRIGAGAAKMVRIGAGAAKMVRNGAGDAQIG